MSLTQPSQVMGTANSVCFKSLATKKKVSNQPCSFPPSPLSTPEAFEAVFFLGQPASQSCPRFVGAIILILVLPDRLGSCLVCTQPTPDRLRPSRPPVRPSAATAAACLLALGSQSRWAGGGNTGRTGGTGRSEEVCLSWVSDSRVQLKKPNMKNGIGDLRDVCFEMGTRGGGVKLCAEFGKWTRGLCP